MNESRLPIPLRALRTKIIDPGPSPDPLLHNRAKLVQAYRRNPNLYPDGIGAWYQPQDWDPRRPGPARLIATGNARLRALDPWANLRAKGEPHPNGAPLPPLNLEPETPPQLTTNFPHKEVPQKQATPSQEKGDKPLGT